MLVSSIFFFSDNAFYAMKITNLMFSGTFYVSFGNSFNLDTAKILKYGKWFMILISGENTLLKAL